MYIYTNIILPIGKNRYYKYNFMRNVVADIVFAGIIVSYIWGKHNVTYSWTFTIVSYFWETRLHIMGKRNGRKLRISGNYIVCLHLLLLVAKSGTSFSCDSTLATCCCTPYIPYNTVSLYHCAPILL